MKNIALQTGGIMGEGDVVKDIEDNIQKLQDDLEDLKKSSG